MKDESNWIKVAVYGNCWGDDTVYLDPENETAKIVHYQITHWGYHDESDYDEEETPISIDEALNLVYPDEERVSRILRNTNGDYSKTLERLAAENRRMSPLAKKWDGF